MEHFRLKKWEIALLAALGVAVLYGAVFGPTECSAWWGTVYPELTESTETFAAASVGAEGVELRFRIAEWIAALLRRLRL